MKHKSWSVKPEIKEEIRKLKEEGMSLWDIAKYMDCTLSLVQNTCYPDRLKSAQAKWYAKNRDKRIKQMADYMVKRKEVKNEKN